MALIMQKRSFNLVLMPIKNNDVVWMAKAIQQAKLAKAHNEVPIGAVIVYNGELIAQSFNQSLTLSDPSAHAEINVLRQAGKCLNNYRLKGATLYVTLEPCIMCLGAMVHARIDRLVYAAKDPKKNSVSTFQQMTSSLNHTMDIQGGILEGEAATILKNFFKEKR